MDTELKEMTKAVFGYTEEEVDLVFSNPKYRQAMEKAPQLMNTDLVFEVDDTHGCACQHRKGQQITINAGGSLVCNNSPGQICIYLLQALTPLVYGAQEFVMAGLDPNELKFTKVGCFDNGAKCGGFGHVSVTLTAKKNS